MNKQNRNKLMDAENKLMAVRWEGSWLQEWVKGEGIKKYTFPVVKTVAEM